MSLPLARYCAYWFVKRRLSVAADTIPPTDEAIGDIDRATLALHIVSDISEAELRSGVHQVSIDPLSFGAAAQQAQTAFVMADAILECARTDEEKPRQATVIAGFADYLALRWIFWEVWRFHIRRRPSDRELPPPFRNADAKRGLADTLALHAVRIGVPIQQPKTFVERATRWRWVSDVSTALITQTKD